MTDFSAYQFVVTTRSEHWRVRVFFTICTRACIFFCRVAGYTPAFFLCPGVLCHPPPPPSLLILKTKHWTKVKVGSFEFLHLYAHVGSSCHYPGHILTSCLYVGACFLVMIQDILRPRGGGGAGIGLVQGRRSVQQAATRSERISSVQVSAWRYSFKISESNHSLLLIVSIIANICPFCHRF